MWCLGFGLSVWFLHVISMYTWFPSGHCDSLPQSKHTLVWWTGNLTSLKGFLSRVNVFDLFRVYPGSRSSVCLNKDMPKLNLQIDGRWNWWREKWKGTCGIEAQDNLNLKINRFCERCSWELIFCLYSEPLLCLYFLRFNLICFCQVTGRGSFH